MNYELIINKAESEVVLALCEDKQLVELHREKGNSQFAVGDIYLGKVRRVMPGLNAAFVDVGYEKDAFLHYLDLGPQASSLLKYVDAIRKGKQTASNLMYFKNEADIKKDGKIGDLISSNQYVLVQVAKEPISAKGPRITTEISLAGRYLVLIPFADKVSVSQKIKKTEEKQRLKELFQQIKPKNFGIIVRTVAEGKTTADIESDLNDLIARWEVVYNALKTAEPPLRVLGELDRTNALLRDFLNENFNNIHVNNDGIAEEVKEYLRAIAPAKEEIVKMYTGKLPIFDNFGIEKQIKSLFGKTVNMKSGAYLIIEHTEALHVIDVNSGNRAKAENSQELNALEVNLEAAAEVARQLRLRDMGGIIVVDFIDLHDQENRKLLYDRLREYMKSDRAKHNILPPSKFGLVQITRQRVRPEMNVDVREVCPSCQGTGKVQPSVLFVDQIEQSLRFIIRESKEKKITICVHPYIEAFITKGLISKQVRWSWEFKQWIKVRSVTSFGFTEFKILNQIEDEIVI